MEPQADGDAEWLQWAYQLQDVQDELFWDDVGGEQLSHCFVGGVNSVQSWYLGPARAPWCRVSLIACTPTINPGATPSSHIASGVCSAPWPVSAGGYFSTTGEDKSVLLRMKEV